MPMLEHYRDQAQLLIDVLPYVAQQKVFALKGGTAINLFHRDLPRLSVDIDLTYVPVNDRNAALRDIDETLDRVAGRITHLRPGRRSALLAAETTKPASCTWRQRRSGKDRDLAGHPRHSASTGDHDDIGPGHGAVRVRRDAGSRIRRSVWRQTPCGT